MHITHTFVNSRAAADHIKELIDLALNSDPAVHLAVWVERDADNMVEVESTYYGDTEEEDEGEDADDEASAHAYDTLCGCNDCIQQRSNAERTGSAD